MQAYTNMVKNLYTQGKQYLWSNDKGKQSMVKVDKIATIYDSNCFHKSKIDTKYCIAILAKFIFLFNQGENFTQDQATQLFFSITKLFQHEEPALRRLIYTFVKQMSNQSSIYIVTSSLLKDIHHKDCNFRRNALRALPVVLDSSNLVQAQRYIKQAMNDSDSGVISAALLAGLQLYSSNEQVVKKWGAEVGQKLKNPDQYVQYHALALIGEIKHKDEQYLKKTIQSLIKQLPCGLVGIQHLRMYKLLMEKVQFNSNQVPQFINFILKQIKNQDISVAIQAAKIACQSPLFSNKDLLEVVKVLQKLLGQKSVARKYVVLKLFNTLLKNSSRKNLVINVKQIQKVLEEKNLTLSALVASILLKVCSQQSLNTLLKGLSKYMHYMPIDYKINVMKSLPNVLNTYPKQYAIINSFILTTLKDEQSQSFRKQAIQVMSHEITQIGGQAKRQCLQELARFLPNAKYQKIHFQILGVINREIKSEDITSEFLKILINEIYLQEGSVRACGLSTLLKISEINVSKKKLLDKVIAKFEKDHDPQVRQRVIFKPFKQKLNKFQLDMIQGYLYNNLKTIQNTKDPSVLGLTSIRKWFEEEGHKIMDRKKIDGKRQQIQQQQKHYNNLFASHSTFKNYGPLRKINNKISISEKNSELPVTARIFIFDNNIVIMYSLENKFKQTILQNVKIQIKHSGQSFKTQHVIPAKQIPINGKSQSYIGLAKIQQSQQLLPEQTFSSIAKFTMKQYNGEVLKTSYEDQLSLQNLQIKLTSYISPWAMQSSQFESQWQKMGGKAAEQMFQLNYASKIAAAEQLIKKYGLTCILNEQTSNSRIQLNLAGKYLGTYKILFSLVIGFDTQLGCVTKAKCLSEKKGLQEEMLQLLS